MKDLSIESMIEDGLVEAEEPKTSVTPIAKIEPKTISAADVHKRPVSAPINWQEKRKFERVEIVRPDFEVAFKSRNQFLKLYVQDISKGGMFIKSKTRIPLGETVEIGLEFPKADNALEKEVVQLKGIVVRSVESGIGISFSELDDSVRNRIESLIIQEKARSGKAVTGRLPPKVATKLIVDNEEAKSSKNRLITMGILTAVLMVGGIATMRFTKLPKTSAVLTQPEASMNSTETNPKKKLSLREAGISISIKPQAGDDDSK